MEAEAEVGTTYEHNSSSTTTTTNAGNTVALLLPLVYDKHSISATAAATSSADTHHLELEIEESARREEGSLGRVCSVGFHLSLRTTDIVA